MARKLAVVALMSVLVVACQSTPWNKTPPPPAPVPPVEAPTVAPQSGLKLSPDTRFPDIPLPEGLRPDTERTFVYQAAGLEICRLVYDTHKNLIDLYNFFAQQVPASGWRLTNTLEAGGAKTLDYAKPGKRLSVTVQNLGVAAGRRITITMTPEGGSVTQ